MAKKLVLQKPFLRGHFHQAAFFLALGACSMLIALSQGPKGLFASIVYGISLAGLFGISALYHVPNWGVKSRLWLKRVDHAAIFILIAGTGTPVFLLGLDHDASLKLLMIFWTAAAVGIVQSIFWVSAPKWVSAIFYVGMGWLSFPYIPEMLASLGAANFWLMMSGGFVYTIGAVIYALKRPNPFPKIFGYHEIFHILVIIAAILHFIVVYQLVALGFVAQ